MFFFQYLNRLNPIQNQNSQSPEKNWGVLSNNDISLKHFSEVEQNVNF